MKTIKLSELFNIDKPTTLIYSKCIPDKNGINYISSKGENNGVVGKIQKIPNRKIYNAGCITVPLKGTVLEAHLQVEKCYVAHQIAVLTPKKEMTDNEKLYYCECIKANKFKYSYGRQADKTLPDLLVPNRSEIPAWVYTTQAPDIEPYRDQIDKYLRDENGKLIIKPDKLYDLIKSGFFDKNEPLINSPTPELNIDSWKEFKISDLFKLKTGKTLNITDMEKGKIPYVSASGNNNGVIGYVNTDKDIFKPNAITVPIVGNSVAIAGYQDKEFVLSNNAIALYSKYKGFNKYHAMFIIPILKLEKFRYGYGRKWGLGRMEQSVIKLPATPEGEPDYQFMEDYIKTLPYSKYI